MSPHEKKEEPPSLSKDDCNALVITHSIKAIKSYKAINQDTYKIEINSLAKACAHLINNYHQTPENITNDITKILSEFHYKSLQEIDAQIKHLFDLRKQAPADTFYGEQEIIKLTTQITQLQYCKKLPINEIIQQIIDASFIQAIKIYDVEIPLNFNLNRHDNNQYQTE